MDESGTLSCRETVYVASPSPPGRSLTGDNTGTMDGVFIYSRAINGHCGGTKQTNQNNDAPAICWPCYGGKNQLFDFHPQIKGGYHIVAEHSAKCLTVDSMGDLPSLGDPVVQRTCSTNVMGQIWTVGGNKQSQQIKEKVTGLCLVRPGTSLNPGTELLLGLCGDGFNSLWTVTEPSLVTASFVRVLAGMSPVAQTPIKSLEFSGICVSVVAGSMDAGAPAVQDHCQEEEGELFSFQRVFDGIYRVVAVHSLMCLTAENVDVVSIEGATVSQFSCRDDAHQLWRITGKGGNQRLILNQHGLQSSQMPYCLNNIGGDDKAGNQIVQWPRVNTGKCEKWSISDALSPEATMI
ncbi:Ricin-type beta-trefoil lectin domain-like protein [Nitzschia inconspicua]|uniref:Ricin-type beta-trefoil lectin domain-like protein n=1 Tax=Nitzschia inconspicua TaxID=303405 RepID=A0A9K3LRJ7_9STRA|nr:Ricin-type beta-trefoil lectin domain-like protein [Nitzschia inconspicua]